VALIAPRPYTVVDVFTRRPLTGNALAVVHDADDLDADTMLAYARETRLSETTFVQSPTVEGATYRNRIFTVTGEVPFAGHPSLGTAVAVAIRRGDTTARYVQETGDGLQEVDVRCGGAVWAASVLQGPVRVGPTVAPAAAMQALGLTLEDAHDTLVPQHLSTGLPALIVPLRSLYALGRARHDPAAISALRGTTAHTNVYAVVLDAEEESTRARSFPAAAEESEDPATGSAAGALCAYLRLHERRDRVRVIQGVELGRPSILQAEVEGDRIRVTGAVVIVVEGVVHLP
jgi:trans-2,3-dihydro-3-hydroxyanthranilate isomerase